MEKEAPQFVLSDMLRFFRSINGTRIYMHNKQTKKHFQSRSSRQDLSQLSGLVMRSIPCPILMADQGGAWSFWQNCNQSFSLQRTVERGGGRQACRKAQENFVILHKTLLKATSILGEIPEICKHGFLHPWRQLPFFFVFYFIQVL